MQIVIDIDDNLYTRLFDNGENYVVDMRRACVAIRKGKPLSKGHGKLKDADELYSKFLQSKEPFFDIDDVRKKIYKAPTIIEADKVESEE